MTTTVADSTPDPNLRIVPYDPIWPLRFAREAAVLRAALGSVAVAIDHVGSTSVPGLAAKPIVDIQITVRALEPFAAYAEPLERLGYGFVPDPEFPDLHFFPKPPAPPRDFHIHVMLAGGDHERRHLAVRDYLRAHADVAAEYATVKRRVAEAAAGNVDSYVAGKDAFVKDLERRALAWWQAGAG